MPILYLAAFEAACALLLAVLSYRPYRPYRELNQPRVWRCWALFWGCYALYQAGTGVHYFQVVTGRHSGDAARVLAVAAAIAQPGLLAAAAWCVRRSQGYGARAVGVSASAVALVGYIAMAALPWLPHRESPLAAPMLLTAAAIWWFCTEVALRPVWARPLAAWLSLVFYSALALHLAVRAAASLGAPIYGGAASVPAAVVEAVLVFGITLSHTASVSAGTAVMRRRVAAIWEGSSDGMRLTDETGVIWLVNSAYCKMMGRSREELVGRSFPCTYEAGAREAMLRTYCRRVRERKVDARFEREVRLEDGRRLWLELSNALLPGLTGVSVLSIFRDVTARREADRAAARREKQLEVLVRASRRVHVGLDGAVVMQAVADAAMELTGGVAAVWAIASGDGLHFAGGEAPSALCGRVLRDLRPAVEQYAGVGPCAGVPVQGRKGELLAYFEVRVTHEGGSVDDQDVLMLEGLAATAAIALENANIVAAQRAAEQEKARSEERYRSVVEASPMGMHFYSLTADGRLLFMGSNPAAEKILGIDHGPLQGLTAEEAFPGLTGTDLPEHYRRVAVTGEPWSTTHLAYRDDHLAGVYEVHAFQIHPSAMAVMFFEVTEQRQAQEALRASEARYRLITENSTDTISAHNADGVFTFVSPACRALCGHDPAELIGTPASAIVHPDDSAAIRRVVDALLAGGEGRQVSYRVSRKQGGWVWVESSIRVIPGPEPESGVSVVSVTRDITERREWEERVRQAQKLESVGRLAGGVAHDFNNILTVINGYASMLADTLEPSDPLTDSVQEIAAAGERAAALTQQLLAFSRKQVMQMRTLDLNASIREAERMLRRVIGEDIDLRLELHPEPVQANADSGQILQVLLNLAINARDAMPNGGRLVIGTRRETLASAPAGGMGSAAPGPYVVLSIGDTGCGIDEEARSHLFEPFYTTKEAGQGTGLGLSTVFGIVQQSGGCLRVESAPGQGSTFQVYLPEVDDPLAPVAAPLVPETTCGWETILVVEDQAEVRRMVTRALASNGYRLLDAADGDEAMAVCERHSGPIHLTITDVIMPGMNGRELADRLTRLRPEMKVLFVSGYPDNAIVGIVGEGINFLQKPFTPDALAERVRRTLGERRSRGNILLVDDEASVRRLLRKVLESAAYTVLEAANGKEALARVRQRPVDLILTDLVMPEKEGLETIRELRATHPGVRIVAMSGAFEGRFLKSAALLGARATLKKPVVPDELLRTIERVLRGDG